MEHFIQTILTTRGYRTNDIAHALIRACDDWYADRSIEGFHDRRTIQGEPIILEHLGMAKRCCKDDANLCEILEINAGDTQEGGSGQKAEQVPAAQQRSQRGAIIEAKTAPSVDTSTADDQFEFINKVLDANNFEIQYREQLERIAANGTVGCYVRLDNADLMADGTVRGGDIRLCYCKAENYEPLTVVNGDVIEAAFSGTDIVEGKRQTTLVMFTLEGGRYRAETFVFDEGGRQITELYQDARLGDVKPFQIMRNAEVNNLDDMDGFGLPKIYGAITAFKSLDLAWNILFGDLEKGDKLLLVNELMMSFDDSGKPLKTSLMKKLFVFLGQRLPDQPNLIQEYNPKIRIEEVTKSIELNLSICSMMFGYGTKKYTFENGQIKTATEYAGNRQDMLQELNKQRKAAQAYIKGIVKAILWFANNSLGSNWDLEQEVCIEFDDSYITDKETELATARGDALSFPDIPAFKRKYVMMRMNCTEEEAEALIAEGMVETEEEEETED